MVRSPPRSGTTARLPVPAPGTARWCDASAALGAVVWLGLLAAGRAGPVERWLLLAVLVLVPLALPVVAVRRRDGALPRTYRLAAAVQPPAALLAAWSALVASGSAGPALVVPPAGSTLVVPLAGSTLVTPGVVAGALTLPWLVLAALLAAHGLGRLLARGPRPAAELCVDAGLVYVAVGAAGLLVHRLDLALGFRPAIVHLAAVHFHYAGFLLPVAAGATGRALPGRGRAARAFRAAAVGIVAGPAVVAAGFVALSPLLLVGAGVLAAAALAVAGLAPASLSGFAPGRRRRAAAALLAVAGLALLVSMPLAVAYGYGAVAEPVVSIRQMVRLHGRANALGFGLAATLAWRLLDPSPRVPAPGVPLSRLRAGRRVGADYVERAGVEGTMASGRGSDTGDSDPAERADPPGQLDDLGAYARPDFDPDAVHPAVRRFYERTGEYDLSFDVTWHRGFRAGARLAARLTDRVGQLNLPGPGESGPWLAAGRVVPVADAADGREGVRAWVRTYQSGDPVFVAAYAAHEHGGERFVNVGLPLPGCTLSAVLRVDELAVGEGADAGAGVADGAGTGEETDGEETGDEVSEAAGGLQLSSRRRSPGGDPGLYLATPAGPVRLPMHERFRVWPAGAAGLPDSLSVPGGLPGDPALVARHEMWLLGRRFLTVEYAIARASEG